jgi:UDP-2-acetamido-2-deoxy-ribo-hexuluronate aminotransferase
VKTIPEIKPIQMVDLTGQYQRLKRDIDAGISHVLGEASFINGPAVKEFARELESYLSVKHVLPCANGTDALQIALMALELPEGSEIITPGFSYIAIAEVCTLLKLKPVFADIDANTFNLDPLEIEKHITPNTRAIIPVHLFGQCADMETILAISEKHNLFVIEDNAQSIGATYTFSDGKTIKFFPAKNLGCYGDGGAIFTNDNRLAERMRMIANHGQKTKYIHDIPGVNSRLDTIQAAVLSVKLKMLDTFNAERQAVAKAYNEAFKGHANIVCPGRNSKSTHVYHQYTLRLKDTDIKGLSTHLQEHGIPSTVHYPLPVYRQKAYEQDISLPVSEEACRTVLSLPMGTEMDETQIEFITSTIKNYLKL